MLTSSAQAVRADEPQTDAQAQQLLQKHRSYVGFQMGDGTFHSMRVLGPVTNKKGEKLEDVTLISGGLAFQESGTMLKKGDLTWHDGFTGSVFWRSFENGFTMPLYGEGAKALASYSMLFGEGTSGLPATFRGDKNVEGKSVSVVRVTMMNGDPIDLYIDPATGAYVKAVIDPDGASETTYHILSYADVAPGKKMIGSYRVGESDEVRTYTKWEPNADGPTKSCTHPSRQHRGRSHPVSRYRSI